MGFVPILYYSGFCSGYYPVLLSYVWIRCHQWRTPYSYKSYKKISQIKYIQNTQIYGFHMTGNTDIHLLVTDTLKHPRHAQWVTCLVMSRSSEGMDQGAAYLEFHMFNKYATHQKQTEENATWCSGLGCSQAATQKQDPTNNRWEKASQIWSPIRDNYRQLPLIGNHTRPAKK